MIITRRDAIQQGLYSAAGLFVASKFADQAWAASAPPVKAKSVIQIWMWGGPCHIDTFDPKPGAGYDYCGALDKPIATNAVIAASVRIDHVLPRPGKPRCGTL